MFYLGSIYAEYTNNWSYRVRINLSLLQEDSSKNSLEVEKHPPMELFANSA